jgi:hypothetical protein
MADNPTKRERRADRIRINLGEPYEVTYWCKQFGCTAPELEETVQNVGINAEVVRTFITARRVR